MACRILRSRSHTNCTATAVAGFAVTSVYFMWCTYFRQHELDEATVPALLSDRLPSLSAYFRMKLRHYSHCLQDERISMSTDLLALHAALELKVRKMHECDGV